MLMSMTGFGSCEAKVAGFGTIRVELRSTNHKFLETPLHLPEGFLSLEERITKEIESRIKRGRLACAINIAGGQGSSVFINKALLKKYILAMRSIKVQAHIQDEIALDTLMHLPGVLSLTQNSIPKTNLWPHLKILINKALDELIRTRRREGEALQSYLKARALTLKTKLTMIKKRFQKAAKHKLAKILTDEERSSLLKDIDITEEVERLTFHIRNLTSKLSGGGPIGKELDFIAQEMQRETNTLGAKSCDTLISGQVIQIKSQIEKIREQVQNIE